MSKDDPTMSTISKSKSKSLRIGTALHQHLELMADKENKSVNSLAEALLANATGFYEPNEVTINAIEETNKEIDTLKRYKSAQEAFDDILG